MRNKIYCVYNSIIAYSVVILFFVCFNSCKKFIEVGAPFTSLNGENVFATDATSISAVTAMYSRLGIATTGGFNTNGIPHVTYQTGLSGDELTLVSGYSGSALYQNLYSNSLSSSTPPAFWNRLFEQIYLANSSIEGLGASKNITPNIKKQLLGECKFIRAFCYFYLTNLYGDVPLVVNTDYNDNSLLPRSREEDVWMQIISDLLEAKELLNPNYLQADLITSTPMTERIRPNKFTATALLARAYLYKGDFANAETQATEVIENNTLYSLSSLTNVFSKNPTINKEAIWQIQPTSSGWNTQDAIVFILPSGGPNSTFNPVYLNKKLVNYFENGDNRKVNWIGGLKVGVDSFYYSNKYKSATLNAPVTEYNTVFRLSELYLIRAEARGRQGKILLGKDDLNTIRNRAGLNSVSPNNENDLLTATLSERRVELFCEWGHRWLDIKRTNAIDTIMPAEASLKSGIWEAKDRLYPISNDELIKNPNLSQTPGY